MVGKQVEELARYCNVSAEDIPKAMGVLAAAKGATLAAGVAIGLRYQPLRRVVLARAQGSGMRAWALVQRLREFSVLERSCKYRQVQAQGLFGHSQSSRILEVFNRARQSGQQQSSRVVEAWDPGKQKPAGRQSQHLKFLGRLKKAGQKLLLQRQIALLQRQQNLDRQLHRSWYGWISDKYWTLADKLEHAVGNNHLLQFFGHRLGVMPKTLAVGTAEGVLLAKLAAPIVYPVCLLGVILMLKQPRTKAVACAQDSELNKSGSAGISP